MINKNFYLGGNIASLYVVILKLLFIIVLSAGFIMCSSPSNNRLDVKAMPLIHKVDERFMSFQIGMSHLPGGFSFTVFWLVRPREGYFCEPIFTVCKVVNVMCRNDPNQVITNRFLVKVGFFFMKAHTLIPAFTPEQKLEIC